VKKSFNIQELFAPKQSPKTSWNQAHAPPPCCRELSKDTHEHDLKHPNSVDLTTIKRNKIKQNKTKQNKLPSFIDRWDRIRV
jgi:hypothetical protein